MNRRCLLYTGSVGLAMLLTGCSSDGPTTPDIAVYNRTPGPQSVTIAVTRLSDEAAVFSKSFTIKEDESRDFQDPITEAGNHRVEVSVEDGPADSLEWQVLADEAVGIQISIERSDILIQQVSS